MSVEGEPYQQPVWAPSESSSQSPLSEGSEVTTNGDRWALIALSVSLAIVLSSCVPGFSCLAPLVIGIIALIQAKNAANPARARTYAWISTAIGIVLLVAILVIVVLYGAMFLAAFSEMNSEMNPEFR